MTDETLFDPNELPAPIDPDKDYYAELVGEGKKYKTNQDAGRAIAEKESMIVSLLREKRELEEDLRSRQSLSEITDRLSRLETASKTSPSTERTDPPETDGEKPEVDFDALVEKKLSQREQVNQQRKNLIDVKEKLVASFGENYPAHVKKIARDLDMSEQELNVLAATKPKVFFKTIGLDDRKPETDVFTPPPSSRMNPGFKPSADTKNWKYYQDMRKSDPGKYHNPSTQLEIHRQAIKLGEAFYQ